MDEETMKQITAGTATTAAGGFLAWVALWLTRMTGLPRRVERLERNRSASDRLLLALADSSLARAPKDKAEAREALRGARDDMYKNLTNTPGGKP